MRRPKLAQMIDLQTWLDIETPTMSQRFWIDICNVGFGGEVRSSQEGSSQTTDMLFSRLARMIWFLSKRADLRAGKVLSGSTSARKKSFRMLNSLRCQKILLWRVFPPVPIQVLALVASIRFAYLVPFIEAIFERGPVFNLSLFSQLRVSRKLHKHLRSV